MLRDRQRWLIPLAFLGFVSLGLPDGVLIAETPARVGERHAAHAIGFQVAAATLGAGTLPALAGVLMRGAGLEALCPFLLAARSLARRVAAPPGSPVLDRGRLEP